MVEKSVDKKHFSWSCLLLQLALLFFLITLISYAALLCFLSSHGFSSLLVTMAVLFVSIFITFVRFFKKKRRLCLAERSQEVGYDVDDEDEDGLIEIALVSEEEEETVEAMSIRQRFRIEEDQEEETDDVTMEEDNLIEIDISIGSIKR